MGLVSKLLIEPDDLGGSGGRAFLGAHTIDRDTWVKSQNAAHKLYLEYIYSEHKSEKMYPAFMRTLGVCKILQSGALVGDVTISEATRPSDSTLCHTETKQILDMGQMVIGGKFQQFRTIEQEVIENLFTPVIYANSLAPHKSLQMVESFFMDQRGKKHANFYLASGLSHAVAIIEKIAKP